MQNIFDQYFNPKSICIIGASSKPGSLGYELTKSVKNYGYSGKLYLINPKVEDILGFKCYSSVKEIKEKVDLAIVMVPKKIVEATISDVIDKGINAVILITAGFKETGREGEEVERKILQMVKNAGARLVGPNCMGIINTSNAIKMNATFVAEEPENGKMAFCSQSGAIGAAVLNSLRETDIRFSQFISVGNKADVSENDILEYWLKEESTDVITYYLESFEDGKKFIKYFIDDNITKPIVIVKGGRTSSGIKAASSHTGALGSSDKVVDAIMQQFGIIRAEDLNDLFNIGKGFENFPLPNGNRIGVVTNAGGPAILTIDTLEKNSLTLAELDDQTKARLSDVVHPEGSVKNPVDLLPIGTAEQFQKANEIVLAEENVDAVISVFVEPIMVKALPVIEAINSINSSKPLLQVVMPLPEFWDEYRKNSKTRKPLFRYPEDPAVVIAAMLNYKHKPRNNLRLKEGTAKQFNITLTEGEFLSQQDVQFLANAYSLPIIKDKLINVKDIKTVDLDYPVVLKSVGKEIVHKSDLGGVVLNVQNKAELIQYADEMQNSFQERELKIDKFLIQPYLKQKFELLIGGFRDPSFGPMVMFGSGGKYVEFLNDSIIRSAYLSDADVDTMIESTIIGKIIQGVRGETSADVEKVRMVIQSVAQMMIDNEFITECDLNPLLIGEDDQVYAVDVRVKC